MEFVYVCACSWGVCMLMICVFIYYMHAHGLCMCAHMCEYTGSIAFGTRVKQPPHSIPTNNLLELCFHLKCNLTQKEKCKHPSCPKQRSLRKVS